MPTRIGTMQTSRRFSFVACVNQPQVARACLLASPCLQPGSGHQLVLAQGMTSAAQGHTWGRQLCRNDWLIQVHQDVLLPLGWDAAFGQALQAALQRWPELALVGVYGVDAAGAHVGYVMDRDRWLGQPLTQAVAVRSLDEMLFAVRLDAGLELDAALGFHLYATDLVLAAQRRGFCSAVLPAPCEHHSRLARTGDAQTIAAFAQSVEVFRRNWADQLPLATPSIVIDASLTAAGWRALAGGA